MTGRGHRTRRASGHELTPGLETAWGIRGRPERGPRPALSLPRIVEAAIGLASSHGLEAVSMGRVAAALGVATMSLYRYVDGKDELLALMMDAVFAAPPQAAAPGEGWRSGLSRWAREHRAVLSRHPWIVRVPIGGPPILPNQLLWVERGLECLGRSRLSEEEKLSVLLLVNGFVRNDALLASDLEIAARTGGAAARDAMSAYGALLSRLVNPQRFPALTALVAAGVFERAGPPDADFDFGLERVLDGIAALIRQR
jgi:AcrR family transcriptional regulator